jgi:hypothetical protein
MIETLNGETEFFFFLDAWNYCRQEKVSPKKIKRKNWTTWVVVR